MAYTPPRRLHLTLRLDQRTKRVTATFRRLWGAWDDPEPVIRILLDQPPGEEWWGYTMTWLATGWYEVPVSDDFEVLSSQERYELLRGDLMERYRRMASESTRFNPARRKG